MTSTSKKAQIEELERQYRDYKDQFEAWKEKNKNSIGTDAYMKYVQQFETWEKDVQKRREHLRSKIEKERVEAEAEVLKRREEAAAREKQAAEAAAYEQRQKAYLAHHQNALQQQQKERERQAAAAQAQAQAQQYSHASSSAVDAHLHSQVTPSSNAYHGMPQQAVQVNGAAAAPAPQPKLWGNTRVKYDHNDPMSRKWGQRAAPPNSFPPYQIPRSDIPMTPCWLLIEQMKEKKLMFEPSPNLPPPPLLPKFSASLPPPSLAHLPPPQVLIEPPEKRPRVLSLIMATFMRVGCRAMRSRLLATSLKPSCAYSTQKKSETSSISKETHSDRSILEQVLIKEQQKPKTAGQKVKQGAETSLYFAVAAGSVAILAGLGYVLFDMFFSAESPEKIYGDALKLIRKDGRCQDMFGESIAGFGEGGRRRSHVAHQKYQSSDGKERIRVVFHLKGDRARGLATVEMEKDDGDWDYRFLLVESKELRSSHVLIDNRK